MGEFVLREEDIAFFKVVLGDENVLETPEILESYGKDRTEDLVFPPDLVVRPDSVPQISKILAYCYENGIPVTTRGGGTGLSAGALPVAGGLVLSVERLNQIINIDEANLQVTVEAAVITEVLQNTLREKNLFYPPDPSSKGSCFIGGNIATNAGGPRAVKYGVVRDYVLNLEVVLPNGEVIWTAANTLKNSTGYNLTQLITGSEGTLGVITKAVLKLIPQPKYRLLLLANFKSNEQACKAVSAIFQAGITPSCLEFIEKDAIDITLSYLGEDSFPIAPDTAAQLLIEVDGQYLDGLYEDCETIDRVLQGFECTEVLLADNAAHAEQFWKLRRSISSAIKYYDACKKADTVVPRAALPELVKGVKEISRNYGIRSICYGHAGDGNLHINIVKDTCSDDFWNDVMPDVKREIFKLVKQLNGTISGEHGVGWIQRAYMNEVFTSTELALQKAIKAVFDPKNLFNPHKIFPE